MPLINCKIHLELNWRKDCVMSTIVDTTFKITNTKLYVPIVTLSSKGNVKLLKVLKEGFKNLFFWNEYQTKIESRNPDNNNLFKELEDSLFLLLITLLLMFLMIQLIIPTTELKETVIQNIFFQCKYNESQRTN